MLPSKIMKYILTQGFYISNSSLSCINSQYLLKEPRVKLAFVQKIMDNYVPVYIYSVSRSIVNLVYKSKFQVVFLCIIILVKKKKEKKEKNLRNILEKT